MFDRRDLNLALVVGLCSVGVTVAVVVWLVAKALGH